MIETILAPQSLALLCIDASKKDLVLSGLEDFFL